MEILRKNLILVMEKTSQVIFGHIVGPDISQVFGIICISGGYPDLLPGFYQVITPISVGISRIHKGKPIRHLSEKMREKYEILLQFLYIYVF